MEKLKRKKTTICIFILPALICYVLIAAIPILCSIVLSFTDWDIAGVNGFIGLDNYVELFTIDKTFQSSISNTLLATILCVLIQIPCAMFLAYQLTKIKKGKNFFKISFFVPNMLSATAIGLMWTFILHYDFGLVNAILKILGLRSLTRAWLGEPSTALVCVIIAVAWQYIGYHMVIHLAAMQDISGSIIESAEIDGATSWQVFRHITFPLIVPILKIDTVLVVTGSLRIFDMIYVMTGGGPNHASEVIATHMYTRSFKGMQFGYGCAMAVILMAMCIIVTGFLNRVFKRGEANIE